MLTPQGRAALKTAFRLLVQDVGGLEAASSVTGYSVGRLSEAYAPQSERMPRTDHALMLELVGGTPRMTDAMALIQGRRIVQHSNVEGDASAALGPVIASAGRFGGEALAALADGTLDDGEAAILETELAAHMAKAEHCRAVLAARKRR